MWSRKQKHFLWKLFSLFSVVRGYNILIIILTFIIILLIIINSFYDNPLIQLISLLKIILIHLFKAQIPN